MFFQFTGDSTNATYTTWPEPSKNSPGSNKGYFFSSKMASSALIQHVSGNVIPKTACDYLIQIKSTSTTKTTGTAPLVAKTNTSNKEGARDLFLSQ